MSIGRRCWASCVRAVEKFPAGSVLAPARTGSRRTFSSSIVCRRIGSRDASSTSEVDHSAPAKHLGDVFPPLEFPEELVRRMLTHGSHKDALQGHNARLSFMGRRVLSTYLLLFLHSTPAAHQTPQLDYDLVASRALNTYVLGEHVASAWAIGEHIRWTQASPRPTLEKPIRIRHEKLGDGFKEKAWNLSLDDEARELKKRHKPEPEPELPVPKPEFAPSVGLYKVAGTTVEAIMGGIFHQFGGSVAHRVFHTRLLPHILLPNSGDGLHDSLHPYAEEVCQRMGGLVAPIVPGQEPQQLEVPTAKIQATFTTNPRIVGGRAQGAKRERVDKLMSVFD
ncbi:hypothetical protein JAAARDRAFT_174469 [Jaapia argillacea MUCL 33604]|uniref:RNase III domain-containing protein n=1 Tax=Jaapia argillacea MUCL 33604 TaxID=933084 RepID=A0A067QA49_9AGAM|nr:hypothetical protein JAAARDRAFT_174469 [Jaapia argillacea MUCL 33604]